jgi:homoserine dehydrogenase
LTTDAKSIINFNPAENDVIAFVGPEGGLTEIEENGRDFDEVLHEAQAKGYAEKDPSADIDGFDAAHKVSLLAQMCFGVNLDFSSIDIEGISEITPVDFRYAHKSGYTIKLIGMGKMTERDELLVSVRPTLIPRNTILAKVSGSLNAVYVLSEKMGETMYYGRGAGDTPTGGAVVSDIISLARDIASGSVGRVAPLSFFQLSDVNVASKSEVFYPYYIRFIIQDRPGILAEIGLVLKKYEVNINEVWQEPFDDKGHLPFVMTLEESTEEKVLAAIAEMGKFDFLKKKPFAMRINALR